jgi:hypothetical protein
LLRLEIDLFQGARGPAAIEIQFDLEDARIRGVCDSLRQRRVTLANGLEVAAECG